MLRPYQRRALEKVREHFSRGGKKALLRMPTGAGKTVCFCEVLKGAYNKSKPALFIVKGRNLVSQASARLKREDVPHGVIMGSNATADLIQVASIDTLYARKLTPPAEIIVIDECFPAGTLVDGQPIESIQVGQLVRSFNHETGIVELRKVVRLFKNPVRELVKVHLSDGRHVVCTPEHPFFAKTEYVKAIDLKEGDCLGIHLLSLQQDISNDEHIQEVRLQERHEKSLLLNGMLEDFDERPTIGKANSQQSNAPDGNKRENEGKPQENWSQAEGSRRKWAGVDSASGRSSRGFSDLSGGIYFPNKEVAEGGLSLPLQGRFSRSDPKIGNRGGRTLARQSDNKGEGSQETIAIGNVRVDRVEILEQTGFNEFGGVSYGDYVYNFEVEGNHNYFVNDVLVHNCHLANTPQFDWLLSHYPDAYILPVTATPFHRRGFRNMAEIIIEPVTVQDLINDKYLVPAIYYAPSTPDLSTVKKSNGDYVTKDLGQAMNQSRLFGPVVDTWLKLASDRPTLLFAVNISHSKRLCQAFLDRGISAEHIDAKTKDSEREKAFERLRDGTTRVLLNVGILGTGVDLPFVTAICCVRPTLSFNFFAQMIGRGTRPHPGKENFIFLDHANTILTHGFYETHRHATLDGKPPLVLTSITVCKQCFACYPRKLGSCPGILADGSVCGYTPPIEKLRAEAKIRHDESGELALITPEELERRQREEWIRKTAITAAARGYKPAYVFVQAQKRFGKEQAKIVWPIVREIYGT